MERLRLGGGDERRKGLVGRREEKRKGSVRWRGCSRIGPRREALQSPTFPQLTVQPRQKVKIKQHQFKRIMSVL